MSLANLLVVLLLGMHVWIDYEYCRVVICAHLMVCYVDVNWGGGDGKAYFFLSTQVIYWC